MTNATKCGDTFKIGHYTARRSRGGQFTSADLEYAQKSGQFAFAAKIRGFTPKKLLADFNGKSFRTYCDKDGRIAIHANLSVLTQKQRNNAAKSGKLDFAAAIYGCTVAYLVSSASRERRTNVGWKRVSESTPAVAKKRTPKGPRGVKRVKATPVSVSDTNVVTATPLFANFPPGFVSDVRKMGVAAALEKSGNVKRARDYAAGDIAITNVA